MVIKQTLEINNLQDKARDTILPESLIEIKQDLPAEMQKTETPDQQEDYHKSEAIGKGQKPQKAEITGRTPSDLAVKFMNEPAFIPTFFIIIAFGISIFTIGTIKDLWKPIIMCIIFNIVYYGINFIARRKNKNGH